VLKPVLDRKGLREVHFYELLFDSKCEDTVLHDLREFVPKFLGIWTTPVHPGRKYQCVYIWKTPVNPGRNYQCVYIWTTPVLRGCKYCCVF